MHPARRIFDSCCSAVGLAALSPLLVASALAIKLEDGGPVFYAQPRIGKEFRTFGLLKFRTMVPGADRHGRLTAPGDPRITRVGRLLRRYKIDELPQLINVLRGEMQLVGPRPEVEPYVSIFQAQYSVLLREPPGVTDPASIVYRHEEQKMDVAHVEEHYRTQILPDKLQLSLNYLAGRTFVSDVAILFRTVLGLGLSEKRLRAATKPKQQRNPRPA